jgi:hypothetical protein
MAVLWQQNFTNVAPGAQLDGTTPDVGPPVVPIPIPGPYPFSGMWDMLSEVQGSSLGGLYLNDIHPDHFAGGDVVGSFLDLGTDWVTTDMEGSLTIVGDSSQPEVGGPYSEMYGQVIFFTAGGYLSAGIAHTTGKLAIHAVSIQPSYRSLWLQGSVPSSNIDIENEATWEYNGSTQDFVIRSANDEISWNGQAGAGPPKAVNDSWRDTPTDYTAFGLDSSRMWYPSAISRWTSATHSAGGEIWLRQFPRDDNLGMPYSGKGRMWSPASNNMPTSRQRSQRQGRHGGTYL